MAGARLSSGAFHSDASAGWHGFSLWCLKKASSPVLRYTILAGALLLVMVLATFPYTETISAFLAPIDLEIISERQTIAFPFGAELHNVNLVSASDGQSLLCAPKVTVSPEIVWLLLGQLCVRFHANVFGGILDAAVRRKVQNTVVNFEFASLNLAEVSSSEKTIELLLRAPQHRTEPPQTLTRHNLDGHLSGHGWIQINGPELVTMNGKITVTVRDLRADLVRGMPPLEFGIAHARISVDGRILTLNDVTAEGPDGALAASGEIRLGYDVLDSVTHLALVLKPAARGVASFGMFLNILPHPPDAGPYHIDGPIRSPTVS